MLDLGTLLLGRDALLLRLGPAALGRDLLLLGLLRPLLGLQSGAVGLQLGLAHLEVALLDGRLVRFRLVAQLRGPLSVGLLLSGLPALGGHHPESDQDDQDDEHHNDDPDDDGCGQFHGRLLAVDSSVRCARRSSCVFR
ncbi:hypothetical protein [Brachybacterium avium]|uniref:hypothetical protein n=1 Tax=Brachybacterium avium TaxID=2017485 RepID=UPI0012FDD163|nr:hypothetical protein [Brachybacterium avium]